MEKIANYINSEFVAPWEINLKLNIQE